MISITPEHYDFLSCSLSEVELTMTLYRKTYIFCEKWRFCFQHAKIIRLRHSKSGGNAGKSTTDYCMNQTRKYDYENFLATLPLPGSSRSAAFAIKAFNIEVSQIQDVVSQKDVGLMRLQFWKEAIDNTFEGRPPQNPITLELAKALNKHKLTKTWFHRLLEAREEHFLKRGSCSTLHGAEAYAEQAVSPVNYLVLESLGVRDVHADHAASHLGQAQGLVTLIRGILHHARRGQITLPTQLLARHMISQEEILRGVQDSLTKDKEQKSLSNDQRFKDVVFDVAAAANQQLEKARSLHKSAPKEASKAFLVAVPVSSYLKRIQIADFDVFNAALNNRNHWLPFTVWWQSRRKTVNF